MTEGEKTAAGHDYHFTPEQGALLADDQFFTPDGDLVRMRVHNGRFQYFTTWLCRPPGYWIYECPEDDDELTYLAEKARDCPGPHSWARAHQWALKNLAPRDSKNV